MAKYTPEELIQLQSAAVVPEFDFETFNNIIEKVKEIQAAQEEEYLTHFPNGRRRSSHVRPKRIHKPKIETDADGWATFTTQQRRKSASGEEGEFTGFISARPNNKNITSSRPADHRDVAPETKAANVFAALESESESE